MKKTHCRRSSVVEHSAVNRPFWLFDVDKKIKNLRRQLPSGRRFDTGRRRYWARSLDWRSVRLIAPFFFLKEKESRLAVKEKEWSTYQST